MVGSTQNQQVEDQIFFLEHLTSQLQKSRYQKTAKSEHR